MPKRPRAKPDAHDLAEEIVRRVAAADRGDEHYAPYIVRFSDPPTASERLQLMACRILGRQVAIMPAKCLTVDEWVERYGFVRSAEGL